MKTFNIIFGILTILLGIAMVVFAWYFFYEDEFAIIQLASLYVALFISILIIAIGGMCITFKKDK